MNTVKFIAKQAIWTTIFFLLMFALYWIIDKHYGDDFPWLVDQFNTMISSAKLGDYKLLAVWIMSAFGFVIFAYFNSKGIDFSVQKIWEPLAKKTFQRKMKND